MMEEKSMDNKIIAALNLLEESHYSKGIIKEVVDMISNDKSNKYNKYDLIKLLKTNNSIVVMSSDIGFHDVRWRDRTEYICLEKNKYIYIDCNNNLEIHDYDEICGIIKELVYVFEITMNIEFHK